jgi:ABC-type cobalt transport system substrate-binding protein
MATRSASMRRFAITAIMLLVSTACNGSRSSPLAAIGEITSAQVIVFAGGTSAPKTVTDPAVLAQLRSLATARGDWHSTWHTPPAGQVRAALYRDTAYVGVVSIGPDFIGARDSSAEQFRSIAPNELPVVATFRVLK